MGDFGVGLWIEEAPSDYSDNTTENESGNESDSEPDDGTSDDTNNSPETTTSARHHPDAYSVNHSTGTVLIDHRGLQQVWWGDNDWFPELVLEDIRMLIAESNED